MVGITGRRQALLDALRAEAPEHYVVSVFDATAEDALDQLDQLVQNLGGLDLFVVSAGWGELNYDLDEAIEMGTVALNVASFTRTIGWGYRVFARQGKGHLASISSVAALRGGRAAPAYNASKAYQSNYLEGLRQKAHKEGQAIAVTDIRPGFVKTPMAKGPGRFWEASAAKAARQIHGHLKRRSSVAYITRRWRLIALLMGWMPRALWARM
jgi:short-subunit dehydrogenase